MISVLHGSGQIEVPAGLTVACIRDHCSQVLNIAPDAEALVVGECIPESYVLKDGDILEFLKVSGRKGAGQHVWTGEQFCRFFQITPEDLQAWITQGLRVKRCLGGSLRITETAVDEFFRGQVIESPYLNTEQAAAYCNVKDAFYGRVERRKIKPLPGSGKENLFTREQCDQMMRGE